MLPQNRRLRHLQGIYLRNLSFARPHGRASDDLDADLSSNKHHDDQQAQLHHSHSSESLRSRPNNRRRSTTLANATPVTRQKQLEYTVESRAADVFFSLHCPRDFEDDGDDPIYISETCERSTNFNFRFFDLSPNGAFVTRQSKVKVKVWAKRQKPWILLLAQDVDLKSLNYLGSLQNHHFPPNCLVFHLVDGIYSLDLSSKRPEPKQTQPLPSSSYNALMKLSTLDKSIQDALTTRETLISQINTILGHIPSPSKAVPQAQELASLASKYVSAEKRVLQNCQIRYKELIASIDARRKAIQDGRAAQEKAASNVSHAQSKIPRSLELVSATREGINGQRRRICEELSRVFRIEPLPSGAPLNFSICGIPLPNTEYDPTSSTSTEDSLAAGLGYVAQLTHILQYYLSVPLPYPISAFGSRSSIRDDISLLHEAQREYPLFLRGGATAQYRFDYGWFLLNKDIEALCVSVGLKVVDIRHTLPNLKYLLYVCSAGSDEMPERKRGGVRGLWAGKLKGRASLAPEAAVDDGGSMTGSSRRNSNDSDKLSELQKYQLEQAVRGEAGAPPMKLGKGYELSLNGPVWEETGKLTLRTKGLRENVGSHA
ncbi:putative UV radiation resistance protein [Xylariaceae sp. FL0016]|nr:putative UV radiation resistance protein [Xylariaceae sp. FL0016]